MNEVEPILVIFEDRKEKEQVIHGQMMIIIHDDSCQGLCIQGENQHGDKSIAL